MQAMEYSLVVNLVFTAFFANSFMDKSSEGKFKRYWWNKTYSWIYKYSLPLQLYERVWYYSIYYPTIESKKWKVKIKIKSREIITPKFKEKFPLSSTFFSFLSDPWHFAKFIFIGCLKLSIFVVSGYNIQLITAVQLSQWCGFTFGYDIFFKKYQNK